MCNVTESESCYYINSSFADINLKIFVKFCYAILKQRNTQIEIEFVVEVFLYKKN